MDSTRAHGAKRSISPDSSDKENETTTSPRIPRDSKTPKLHSLQLDRLYKQFLKENNANSKSKVTPNLKSARKNQALAPLAEASQNIQINENPEASTERWEIPKKTSKVSNKIDETSAEDPGTSHNTFNILSNEDEMELEEIATASRNTGNSKKTLKPPPIYTVNTNIQTIINILKSMQIPKTAFAIKEVNKENHTIYINQLEHHQEIVNNLRANKIQHYTFTPKHTKPKSIILKGVKGNFSTEEIKSEIDELKIPNLRIIKVNKFNYNKTDPEKFHYLIQVAAESKTAELFKVKTLAYQRVRWEHLKRQAIFQCKNCQRLGHASKNCSLNYRCVKCAQSHEPGKCPITALDNRAALKCANCNQSGHPASYKGCQFIKFAMDQKKLHSANLNRNTINKVRNIASSVRKNISYAQATSGTQAESSSRHTMPAEKSTDHHYNSTTTGSEPHLGNYQQSSQPPRWIQDFKQEIASLFSNQLQTLAAQIATNTSKIEYILNTLFTS